MELRWERATILFQFLQSRDHSALPLYLYLGFRNWTDATKWNNLVSSQLLFIQNISPFLKSKPSQPAHGYHIYLDDVGSTQSILLNLHNSSHHTQPHSIIVKYVKYLWLNKVLNRRGKLWTCFRHLKTESRKLITLITSEPLHSCSRYMHYYFQSGVTEVVKMGNR